MQRRKTALHIVSFPYPICGGALLIVWTSTGDMQARICQDSTTPSEGHASHLQTVSQYAIDLSSNYKYLWSYMIQTFLDRTWPSLPFENPGLRTWSTTFLPSLNKAWQSMAKLQAPAGIPTTNWGPTALKRPRKLRMPCVDVFGVLKVRPLAFLLGQKGLHAQVERWSLSSLAAWIDLLQNQSVAEIFSKAVGNQYQRRLIQKTKLVSSQSPAMKIAMAPSPHADAAASAPANKANKDEKHLEKSFGKRKSRSLWKNRSFFVGKKEKNYFLIKKSEAFSHAF